MRGKKHKELDKTGLTFKGKHNTCRQKKPLRFSQGTVRNELEVLFFCIKKAPPKRGIVGLADQVFDGHAERLGDSEHVCGLCFQQVYLAVLHFADGSEDYAGFPRELFLRHSGGFTILL